MKKIRIAQIGAGHDHANAVISTLKMQSDLYDLVGYATVEGDEPNFSNCADCYADVRRMTVEEIWQEPGLDAVCIEAEDRHLTEWAIRAAEHGLHIQMDKPGSESDEEFDRLIDLVEKNGRVFHTGYMYRYNPAVLQLKEDIAAGRLGEIYAVEAQMNCFHQPQKRAWLGNYPAGMLYYLGCHLIDLVYSICGEPEEVIPLSTSTGADGVQADDIGMAVFRYPHGVSFVKSTAIERGGFERRQLVVCGTKGTVEVRPFERLAPPIPGVFSSQTTDVREAYDEDWHKPAPQHTIPAYGRYDAMFRAFAAYVRGEKTNPYTYEYERALHKLILRACGKKA